MNLARHRYFYISGAGRAVKLGSIFRCSSNGSLELEDSVEIASLFDLNAHPSRWSFPDGVGEVMNEGWTRFRSSDVSHTTISLVPILFLRLNPWLSQANYIFGRHRIVSNFEYYVYLRSVNFELSIPETREDAPAGFLFLCPEHNLQTGQLSFCWPDQERATYWSLDPTGAERLSTKEASQLGFPPLRFTATAIADFWDAPVYNGLRQFHQAKGFDPDSQDLVRHLGWPLYQLSGGIDVPSARDTDSGMVYASDDESEHSPTSDIDVDGEVPDPEDDNHDGVHKDCAMSECVEILNCQPADAVQDGTAALSATFKFLIYLQLVLFLFLGFSLLNDHI
ncbi:hypothetical protein MSAN_00136700 [Mycena sanguinolenta]|uniref:Uncharacterized protein n=1 Tax=Mycena sanguinolenta TaxID=230812 RepID=A0A8H6ZGN2_9AGAR|nr:hypothetical protein MSAN_00136700 [Mycena sanguinolenta]